MADRYDAEAEARDAEITARGIVGPLALCTWTERVMRTAIEVVRDALVARAAAAYTRGYEAGAQTVHARVIAEADRQMRALQPLGEGRAAVAHVLGVLRDLPLTPDTEASHAGE